MDSPFRRAVRIFVAKSYRESVKDGEIEGFLTLNVPVKNARWVERTPFGKPVLSMIMAQGSRRSGIAKDDAYVPDVKKMVASSSGPTPMSRFRISSLLPRYFCSASDQDSIFRSTPTPSCGRKTRKASVPATTRRCCWLILAARSASRMTT